MMKFGVLGLIAIILSGCGILNGSQRSAAEEAYYVPVIMSDRAATRNQAAQISDRTQVYGAQYTPVITR